MPRIIKHNFEDVVTINTELLIKYNREPTKYKDLSILLIEMIDKPTLQEKYNYLNNYFRLKEFFDHLRKDKYKCVFCNKHLLIKNKDDHEKTQTHMTNIVKSGYSFNK